MHRMERVAYELWRLLDDIDTADDIAKSDDAMFRELARRYQRLRFDFMSGEEWESLHALAAAARQGGDGTAPAESPQSGGAKTPQRPKEVQGD